MDNTDLDDHQGMKQFSQVDTFHQASPALLERSWRQSTVSTEKHTDPLLDPEVQRMFHVCQDTGTDKSSGTLGMRRKKIKLATPSRNSNERGKSSYDIHKKRSLTFSWFFCLPKPSVIVQETEPARCAADIPDSVCTGSSGQVCPKYHSSKEKTYIKLPDKQETLKKTCQ